MRGIEKVNRITLKRRHVRPRHSDDTCAEQMPEAQIRMRPKFCSRKALKLYSVQAIMGQLEMKIFAGLQFSFS